MTCSTITEIKLWAACREGEGSQHEQPSLALPNIAQYVEPPLPVRATFPVMAWQVVRDWVETAALARC